MKVHSYQTFFTNGILIVNNCIMHCFYCHMGIAWNKISYLILSYLILSYLVIVQVYMLNHRTAVRLHLTVIQLHGAKTWPAHCVCKLNLVWTLQVEISTIISICNHQVFLHINQGNLKQIAHLKENLIANYPYVCLRPSCDWGLICECYDKANANLTAYTNWIANSVACIWMDICGSDDKWKNLNRNLT